ncbi:hypothetical protein [Niastella populi]|uniref:Autotransporter domain-containing protein n=1 Tax=Niastella populi TaxID=550983 RepID=A0A1V9G252_9BACT|nr:hypothetical protein [Niastella populi]OQP64634.1 hypothetical protein A4R26_16450 [Niastella populi]
MMRLNPIVMLMACLFIAHMSPAQDSLCLTDKVSSFPAYFLDKINKRTSGLEAAIISKTERYLKKVSKEERRLKKKLFRKDSAAASQLFPDPASQYRSFQNSITEKINISKSKEYIPFLDTLTTSLHFLEKNATFLNNSSVQQSLLRINKMKDQFQAAKELQRYMQDRRKKIREQLGKLNMLKELKQYNKKLYYYQAQVEEYRTLFNQPGKLERKAIDMLTRTKRFQEFMAKNSLLASLFPQSIGANNLATQTALPGLQFTSQVNTLIQQTIGSGPNVLQSIQSNMQQAQSQLQQLKDKVNAMGKSDEDANMPDFKPNSQRTKSFWSRWELGTNLQSIRSNTWLPSATQIGFSAGYKLNDRSVVGVGMAGNIGWGKSIKHLVVSYEGVGARGYFDWKLKGSFWLSAGYEMNYRSAFNRIEQLQTLNVWQQSGLVGISKKYKVSKKMKGSMNLLWDYLSYSQVPRTQPVIFRFGYTLK